MNIEKLMTTNWARRAVWYGAVAAVWCVGWDVYAALAWPRGWVLVVFLTAMTTLAVWQLVNLPENWRRAREYDQGENAWVWARQQFYDRMAGAGVPLHVVDHIDGHVLRGEVDVAKAEIEQALIRAQSGGSDKGVHK